MKRDDTEVLTSLLDAEPIDAEELSACLAAPENQKLLSDLALLRSTLAADSATPSATFERRMEEMLRPRAARPARWAGWAAAAVVTLAVGLVLIFGVRDRPVNAVGDSPPSPDRVLSFSEHGSWS